MISDKISPLDKKILLKFVTGLSDKDLFLLDNSPSLSLPQKLHYKYLTYQRSKGVPIAFLIREKEFYGRKFILNNYVLIPRPETEQIIDLLKKHNTKHPVNNLLDLCTGSGCLGITAKLELDQVEVDLLDISRSALKVAHKNLKLYDIDSSLKLIHSNIFQNISSQSHYDVILTNPPYIPQNQPELVDINTHLYEPHIALYSGKDGLDMYRQIFKQIKQKQISYKLIIGEFGFGQKKQLDIELRQNFNGCKIEFHNDLQGIPRIFTLLAT